MSIDKKDNVDKIMDDNGFKIQTLCVDVVIKAFFLFLFLIPIYNLKWHIHTNAKMQISEIVLFIFSVKFYFLSTVGACNLSPSP